MEAGTSGGCGRGPRSGSEVTRHEYPYIHQYYTYDGQPRERVLTDIAAADAAVEQEMEEAEKLHPAGSRRQRIQALDRAFKHIPVKRGTQQSTAMDTVRDRARVLGLTIEERCPVGPEKDLAIQLVLQAMFWANHAISHR